MKSSSSKLQLSATDRRILVMILSLSALLRLYGVTNPLFDACYWRQTETAAIARNYVEDNAPFLDPEIDWVGPNGHAEMEFPLFPFIISWLYRVFGEWDGFGRILAILCSVGVTWTLFQIGARRFSVMVGLFAAAFFAASPLAVYYGRTFQPDMMMVFLSTFAVYCLLRYQDESRAPYYFLSALSLAFAALLKPPSLMVGLIIAGIFLQQFRWTIYRRWQPWLYCVIVFTPMLLWFSHARAFYEESGASFMWHYKEASWRETFWQYLSGSEFWKTLSFRISDEVLGYVALLPFLIGIGSLLAAIKSNVFLWTWLLGVAGLYFGVPGHHIGHNYYSLLAVPPLSLTAAVGCRMIGNHLNNRFWLSPRWCLALPLLTAAVGMYLLISRGSYDKQYIFYDDAVAMRETIPQDALLAVMDEMPHTPEFFYFINRNGWHRMRIPHHGMDDVNWLEDVRGKGATHYIGLNEFHGNHPFHSLLAFPYSRYLWSHYTLHEAGTRYYTARLDQPLYGMHLFEPFHDQHIAVTDSLRPALEATGNTLYSLKDLDKTGVVIADFHHITADERDLLCRMYPLLLQNGLRMTWQQGGRVVLERNQSLEPDPEFMSSVFSSAFLPNAVDGNAVRLGLLPPGAYRCSLEIEPGVKPAYVSIQVHGEQKSEGLYFETVAAQVEKTADGDRIECFFTLSETSVVDASLHDREKALPVRSVVWMKDIQCIPVPHVMQAERMFHADTAELVADPQAQHGTALRAYSQDEPVFACYGPYHHYPSGVYDVTFRVRVEDEASKGNIELRLFDSTQNRALAALRPDAADYSDGYNEFTLSAEIMQTTPLETLVLLHENSSAFIDSISIRQEKRVSDFPEPAGQYDLTLFRKQPYSVSSGGSIRYRGNDPVEGFWLASSPIVESGWNVSFGWLAMTREGKMVDRFGKVLWDIQLEPEEKILALDVSRTHETAVAVNSVNKLYRFTSSGVTETDLPSSGFPAVDAYVDRTSGYVLYADGLVVPFGGAAPVEGLPRFGSDVARAIAPHPKGFCVVDSNGAIHTSSGVPPIKSPHYRTEDWIIEAERRDGGEWHYLTKDGEILTFSE